ncbi:MAG: chromosomal replication initiation ATPase DnaA, partial [Bacteroidia bacterium]
RINKRNKQMSREQAIANRLDKRKIVIQNLNAAQELDEKLLYGEDYDGGVFTKKSILKAILKLTETTIEQVFTKNSKGKMSREMNLVEVRKLYSYICREHTEYSLKEIGIIEYGTVLHAYDHSTIIHHRKSWGDIMDTEPTKRRLTENIIRYLKCQ